MKRVLYTAVLCSLLAFTCNKSDVSSNVITGTWELVETQPGMTPTYNPPAGTERLVLSPTNYEIHTKNSPVQSGTYTIVEDHSVESEVCLVVDEGKYTHRVLLEGVDDSRKIFFQLEGIHLTTLSGCFALDGGVYKKYIRISGNSIHTDN